jgi:hypothetical protein
MTSILLQAGRISSKGDMFHTWSRFINPIEQYVDNGGLLLRSIPGKNLMISKIVEPQMIHIFI